MESFFKAAFSPLYIVFTIFLFIGLLELVVVLLILHFRRKIVKNGQQTTGRVIELQPRRTAKGGGTVYYPVFQFTTFMNEEVTKRGKMGSKPSAFNEGEEVVIYYNPEKPQQFVVANDKSYRLIFWIAGGAALLFLLTGVVGLVLVMP